MFVDTVLKLIKEKGITKNKLLLDLGLNKTSFLNWEQRGNVPNGDVVLKIAEYLGVSTDYLLTGKEKEASLDEQLEGIDFALWGEVKELTDGEKKDILAFVKFKKTQRGE